ncbi:MAG TPA: AAA family ATPase [Actinomycetota bacterium]
MSWKKARLVGRAAETVFLQAELQRAMAGELRFVLLLGDPGLGKSRLAEELLAFNGRRTIGLTARAFPLGDSASFALWAEAIERHFRALTPEDIDRLCGHYLDDLAGLLRSVATIQGKRPQNEPVRPQLLEGLAVIIQNLAQQAPVVIFLDDVHLADASSWQALDYIARNLASSRVLLIAAARPAELRQHQAATDVLLALEQEDRVQRLELTPLEPDALAELAETVLETRPRHELVDWLVAKTRGNPLFALLLLQALLDEGADLSAPELRSIPEGLAGRVKRQLGLLDEPTVATLEVMAVLGHRVELSELVQATSRTLERLGDILHTLVQSRLVVDEERGPVLTYEIAHPLIQEAIYEGIGSGRRRAMHRLVGRALMAAGRLGVAAPHFARSADRADGEAIEAMREALRQAEERGAHGESLSILSALVQILPYGDQRWLQVLDAMSMRNEQVFRGGLEARMAIDALRAIDLVLVESPDPARRAAVQFRLASLLVWGMGELEEGEASCTLALAMYEKAGDHAMALVAANELAHIRGLRGDLAGQKQPASEVAAAAEEAGELYTMMQALGTLGEAHLFLGEFEAANAAWGRTRSLAEMTGKPHHVTFATSFLACSIALSGRVGDAVPLIEHAKSVDPAYPENMLLESETLIHWLAGDFPAAVATAEEVAHRSQRCISRRRAWALAFGALAAAERSSDADAKRYLRLGMATYAGRPWLWFTDAFGWAEGVLAWREGKRSEGRCLIERSAHRMLEMSARPWAAFVLADLAELAFDDGDVEMARWTRDHLDALASSMGTAPTYRGLAAIAAGWSELASDDAVRAAEWAEDARELLAPTGSRAFVGRALALKARALQRTDRPAAVQTFRQAADAFRACGATLRLNRAVEELKELGTRGRRAAGATLGPDALTQRERQVVRLASEGMTHREIGEKLFIGQRTVETHLANAYAKLGIESKVDLMRRISQLGL